MTLQKIWQLSQSAGILLRLRDKKGRHFVLFEVFDGEVAGVEDEFIS